MTRLGMGEHSYSWRFKKTLAPAVMLFIYHAKFKMASEKSEITPAGQGPLDHSDGSAAIDTESNQGAIPAPTEALRKLWTKFPLTLAFVG